MRPATQPPAISAAHYPRTHARVNACRQILSKRPSGACRGWADAAATRPDRAHRAELGRASGGFGQVAVTRLHGDATVVDEIRHPDAVGRDVDEGAIAQILSEPARAEDGSGGIVAFGRVATVTFRPQFAHDMLPRSVLGTHTREVAPLPSSRAN